MEERQVQERALVDARSNMRCTGELDDTYFKCKGIYIGGKKVRIGDTILIQDKRKVDLTIESPFKGRLQRVICVKVKNGTFLWALIRIFDEGEYDNEMRTTLYTNL